MTSATFIFGFNAKAVEMGMARLKNSVSSFGKSFAGMLAGGLAIGSIVQGFRSAIAEGAKLQDLADRFNLPASEIGRFAAAGKEMGVSTEDVAKSLAKLSVNQTKALQGNEALQDAFSAVGISMEELQSSSPTELLNRISDAFKEGRVSGDEMAVAMDLLGKGGINMVGMLRLGSEEIGRLAEEMGYFDDETVEALDKADDAITKLGTQATLVFGQVASAIAPAVEVLAGLVKSLNEMGALLPVLGAVTGFLMGGPVGAAVGAAAGLALQASTSKDKSKKKETKGGQKDFVTDPDTGERISKKGQREQTGGKPTLSERDQAKVNAKVAENDSLAFKIQDLKAKKQNLPLGEKGKAKVDEEIAKNTEKIFKNNEDIAKIQGSSAKDGKKGKKYGRGLRDGLMQGEAGVEDYGAVGSMENGGLAEAAGSLKEKVEQKQASGGRGGDFGSKGVMEKLDKIHNVLTEIKNQNNTFN